MHVPTGNTFSALPLIGPGGTEWWQPCLSQAARSGPIPYQNPFLPLQSGPRTRVEFINAAQAPSVVGPGPQALPSAFPPVPCLCYFCSESCSGFPLQEQKPHTEGPPGLRQQRGRGFGRGGGFVYRPCGRRDVILAFDRAFPSKARQERFVHWPPVPIAGLPE